MRRSRHGNRKDNENIFSLRDGWCIFCVLCVATPDHFTQLVLKTIVRKCFALNGCFNYK